MRKPDLIIGPRDNPQTIRWHIFVWRGWQLSLHKWLRSDDDRAPHDHKADNISLLLTDCFREMVREREWFDDYCAAQPAGTTHVASAADGWIHAGDGEFYRDVDRWYLRWPLRPYFRKGETLHRVELLSEERPVWSLWLRWPARRRWGYGCPKGWVDADDYNMDKQDGDGSYNKTGFSEVGRGCG